MLIGDIIDKIEKHITTHIPDKNNFGEVFTDLSLVEEMISILPDSFWTNPSIKILDPCNGIGNFPAIIVKKLMNGLSDFETDENLRYKYIVENIIYVCEIQPDNITKYLNIFNYNNIFNMNFFEGSYLSKSFDDNLKDVWNINKFDLIIGNPPYQQGSNSRSAISFYHKFVEKSTSISNLVLMVTPSKWYSNPSMNNFRINMINKYGLKILNDITKDVFKNVEIKGGVSYFLLDKNYTGLCMYNNIEREFKNNLISTENCNDLLDKLKSYNTFANALYSDQYFGIRNKDERFLTSYDNDCIICHVSTLNGSIKYINKNNIEIKDNHNKYKVFIPTASGNKKSIGVLGRLIIGKPEDVCSRSFVHFTFNSQFECESFISYLNTNFAKKLIALKKQTQLVKKDCFTFLPIVPLDRIWNDAEIIQYFKL